MIMWHIGSRVNEQKNLIRRRFVPTGFQLKAKRRMAYGLLARV